MPRDLAKLLSHIENGCSGLPGDTTKNDIYAELKIRQTIAMEKIADGLDLLIHDMCDEHSATEVQA